MSTQTKIITTSVKLKASNPEDQVTAAVDWWSLLLLTRIHLFPVGSDVCIAPCRTFDFFADKLLYAHEHHVVWGLLMAAHRIDFQPVDSVIWLLFLWSFGETVAHSAGCVLNDILDRHVDGLVERSRDRPLASGSVTLRQAVYLAISLHSIILGVLGLCGFPAFCAGLAQVVFFGWTYPLVKRWTYWPQAWLGITFGWGILKGWLSLDSARVDPYVIGTLWCGNICWTIVYDTIYACQDRKDDIQAGVKSTAVLFGDYVRTILSLFAAAFILCLFVAGNINGQGAWYFAISVGGAACHLAWQLYTVDFNNVRDCKNKFKSNGSLGSIISIGLLLDYLI